MRQVERAGFSLVEVMAALAILSVVLVTVVATQSQSITLTEKGRDISFATELARSKMAELEVEFSRKGFGEIEENDGGNFEAEELKEYRWSYELKKVEIPQAVTDMLVGQKQQNAGIGMGAITDILNRSMRELVLKVFWGEEKKGEFMELRTFLTDDKALPQIGGALGGGGKGG